jgi:hypothetical protein
MKPRGKLVRHRLNAKFGLGRMIEPGPEYSGVIWHGDKHIEYHRNDYLKPIGSSDNEDQGKVKK